MRNFSPKVPFCATCAYWDGPREPYCREATLLFVKATPQDTGTCVKTNGHPGLLRADHICRTHHPMRKA